MTLFLKRIGDTESKYKRVDIYNRFLQRDRANLKRVAQHNDGSHNNHHSQSEPGENSA